MQNAYMSTYVPNYHVTSNEKSKYSFTCTIHSFRSKQIYIVHRYIHEIKKLKDYIIWV